MYVLAVVRPGSNKLRLNDLQDLKTLEVEPTLWPELITQHNPGVVICAQWSGVLKQDRENYEMQEKNIDPIMKLANAAAESNVGTFVCLGSQAESKESTASIQEIFCNTAQTAYGVVKANLHSQLKSFFESTNCRFVWARVFSVYGPSDFSDSLLVQLNKSEIIGKKFIVSHPSKYGSYLYEDDFASAIEELVINYNISGCVNVGNPVLNQIRNIVAIWNRSIVTDSIDSEPDQSNIGFFPETRKLRKLGWEPSISLEEGIQRTRKAFSERTEAQ